MQILLASAICLMCLLSAYTDESRYSTEEKNIISIEKPIDIYPVFLKTLLLPSISSYESKHYLLSAAQGVNDLGFLLFTPVALIYGGGTGGLPIILAGLLGNRLVSLGLNPLATYEYNNSIKDSKSSLRGIYNLGSNFYSLRRLGLNFEILPGGIYYGICFKVYKKIWLIPDFPKELLGKI